jgi:hypothetical protein
MIGYGTKPDPCMHNVTDQHALVDMKYGSCLQSSNLDLPQNKLERVLVHSPPLPEECHKQHCRHQTIEPRVLLGCRKLELLDSSNCW